MNNEEKITTIISMLDEEGIDYRRNYHIKWCDVDTDIFIPKLCIAIFDGDSQEKFLAVRNRYSPIFIRETETVEHTMEKVRSVLALMRKAYERRLQRIATAEERRQYTLECEERHRKNVARREERKRRLEEKAKRAAEKKAAKEKAERPRRKRIVRYEKV